MPPSVSVLTGFDCIRICMVAKGIVSVAYECVARENIRFSSETDVFAG